jgi:hypothetical protein
VQWYADHWCHVQFLLVTNLPTLSAPGWTRIVQTSIPTTTRPQTTENEKEISTTAAETETANSFIVQSREAKFLAWKVLPNVNKDCAAVVYMDGYLKPKFSLWPEKFEKVVEQVKHHPWGLSQVKQKYFNGLTMSTILHNLVRDGKDTTEHVNATYRWLTQQDDFQEIMTYYLNKYFGE